MCVLLRQLGEQTPELPDDLAEFLPRADSPARHLQRPAQVRVLPHQHSCVAYSMNDSRPAPSPPRRRPARGRNGRVDTPPMLGVARCRGSRAPGSVAGPVLFGTPRSSMRPPGLQPSRRTRRPQRLRLPEPREPTANEHAAQPPAEPADASTPINFDDPHYRQQAAVARVRPPRPIGLRTRRGASCCS